MKPVNRLAWYLKQKKIKYTNLEKETGLVQGYLSKQIRSEASIGADILEKICNACPDLNPAWLLTGKGNFDVLPQNAEHPAPTTAHNYQSIKEDALAHLHFIDNLPINGEEKYRLCKAYAEKLVLQAMMAGNKKEE